MWKIKRVDMLLLSARSVAPVHAFICGYVPDIPYRSLANSASSLTTAMNRMLCMK